MTIGAKILVQTLYILNNYSILKCGEKAYITLGLTAGDILTDTTDDGTNTTVNITGEGSIFLENFIGLDTDDISFV